MILHGLTGDVRRANREVENENFLLTEGFEPETFRLKSEHANRSAISWDIEHINADRVLPECAIIELSNVYENNGQFVSPETRTVARGR